MSLSRRRKRTKADDEKILRLKNDGLSVSEIVERTGFSSQQVRVALGWVRKELRGK
jgi:DNA invertase Pin-like site-specific DNA recombinase